MSNITEWQLASRQNIFPFDQQCLTLLDSEVASALSSSILDATIIADSGSTFACLLTIVVLGDTVSLEVGFSSGSIATGTDTGTGLIHLKDAQGYSRGVIALADDAAPLLAPHAGSFFLGEVPFDATTVMSVPSSVVERIVVDGQPIAGRLRLIEGDGIRLESADAGQSIVVSAVGEIPVTDNVCPPFYEQALKFLTLNDVDIAPSSSGDIAVIPAPSASPSSEADPYQLVRITTYDSGLNISLVS